MGFIADMFNSNKGAGFEAKAADITNATTPEQLAQSQAQTQQGLGQQQAFLQALQGQNGIGNQSSVFNQLQNVASGQGPNPAQTALANATGQNVANQAALMGSQRGASQNAGLMARQAANQGANIQQQAAGQAANMQANQSLNALNQMGGIAGQQVNQQAGTLQNYNQNAQNNQAAQMNAQNAFNQNNVAMQSNMNNANQAIAAGNQKAQGDLFGGLMSGVGSAISSVAMSDENQKKNITNADGQIQQFLDNTGAHQYEYKNPSLPGTSPGQHISPMAQELEKSKLGSQMVQESPNGKMVDYHKAAPVMMAALSQINKRLEAMEKGSKSASTEPRKMAEGGMTQVSDQGANAQLTGLQVADMSGFKKGVDNLTGAATAPLKSPMGGSQDITPQGEGTPMAGDPMQAVPEMPGAMPSIPGMPAGMPMLAANGGAVPAPMSGYDAYMANRAAQEARGIPPASPAPYGRGQVQDINQANPAVDPAWVEQQRQAAQMAKGVQSKDSEIARRTRAGVEQTFGAGMANGGQAKSYVGDRLKNGGHVPGKPKTKGDDYKNDTVKALLSPGEIVIPRSIAQGRNAPKKAAEFVAAILAKQGMKRK